MAEKQDGKEILACSLSDFHTARRKRVTVDGRDIFIVKLNDSLYALDSFCYHAGGPLYKSDIEDLGGRTCLVCPWHKYKVCVDSGENIYQSIDPHNLSKPPEWKTAGVRQRTHQVSVHDGNVYVILSSMDNKMDSDVHNTPDRKDYGKIG